MISTEMTNSTSTTMELCPFSAADYIQAILLLLMCVVGVISNIVVLVLVTTRPILPCNQRWAIGNLAFLDCSLSLTGLFFRYPVFILSDACNDNQFHVSSWCVISSFLFGVFGYINTIALIPITVDRFVVFWKPIHYKCILDRERMRVLIAVSWIPNIVFSVAEGLLFSRNTVQINFSPYMGTCTYNIFIETVIKEVVCLALPTIFIFIMYCGISVRILKPRFSNNGLQTPRVRAHNQSEFQMKLLKTPVIVVSITTISSCLYITAKYIIPGETSGRIADISSFMTVVANPILYIFRIPNIKKYLKYDYWVDNRYSNRRKHSSTPAALIFSLKRRNFLPRHTEEGMGSWPNSLNVNGISRRINALAPIISEEVLERSTLTNTKVVVHNDGTQNTHEWRCGARGCVLVRSDDNSTSSAFDDAESLQIRFSESCRSISNNVEHKRIPSFPSDSCIELEKCLHTVNYANILTIVSRRRWSFDDIFLALNLSKHKAQPGLP